VTDYFSHSIVFIDDECLFCNFWGNYIAKNDKSNNILISSSSSKVFDEAKKKNHSNFPNPELTIILYFKGQYFTKSTAVLMIAKQMKIWYFLLLIGYLIPKKIRDLMYDFIAKRRKSIMKNDCVIDELRNREKFIT
jgi:predicted DCC family thiol-disulfide oxidoreductase YuxK